jgi:hypothetical protein
MHWTELSWIRWLFDSERGARDRLIPRWLFLRALGLIYFSAFFSLLFQIRGLIGPEGILPAGEFLPAVASYFGSHRYWYAPTLLWISSSGAMLMAICWAGLAASVLLTLNFWPRGMLAVCFVCFLSFVSTARDFSGYQSDGMLLEAGFIALFFTPPGFRPGWGKGRPPSRASLFLLQWEWFRIYFGSGVAKIASGEPQWRNFTAMDEYYQNGPLPTWIGWYVQHLPHSFHAATAFATLALELVLVWTLFLPRRARQICFLIVTPFEIGIILTANYTFLNYLVLVLGILLLDDRYLLRFLPLRWKEAFPIPAPAPERREEETVQGSFVSRLRETAIQLVTRQKPRPGEGWQEKIRRPFTRLRIALALVMLSWIFYATTAQLLWRFARLPLPETPVTLLEPSRIANQYGLFAVMTRGRYEIEFQGSDDGQNWVPYPFRYKPQDPSKPPGIYAPYQPRFDWNLWFASLGEWREYKFVVVTEERLLSNRADVLALFAGNPFAAKPPREVRAVLWRYWFTAREEKRAQGMWWSRQMLGLYAPTLERDAEGKIGVVEWPTLPPQE